MKQEHILPETFAPNVELLLVLLAMVMVPMDGNVLVKNASIGMGYQEALKPARREQTVLLAAQYANILIQQTMSVAGRRPVLYRQLVPDAASHTVTLSAMT